MTLYRFLFAPVLLAVAVLAGTHEPARTMARPAAADAPGPAAAPVPAAPPPAASRARPPALRAPR